MIVHCFMQAPKYSDKARMFLIKDKELQFRGTLYIRLCYTLMLCMQVITMCVFLLQVDLTFSREALYAIADQAASKKTGARGLRSIMVSLKVVCGCTDPLPDRSA